MYNTVLVAFDNSEFSKAALTESSNWIKRHGGRLVLVHAVYFDEQEFTLAPYQREKRFEFGKEACYRAREKAASKFGIDAESLVCEGEPHDVIVDIAQEKKADLIAMGTHGRKGLKKFFLGSVTSRVIVKSPCDVLIVKKPPTEYNTGYRSMLLCFDGSEFGRKALHRACQLSKIDGADLTVLYVIPRYEEMVEFFRTSFIKENLLQDAKKIIDEAKKLALEQGVSIKTAIKEGDPAEKIIETAQRLKSDLIIEGTHGWTGINKAIIGSIVEAVISDVSCPVLIVR